MSDAALHLKRKTWLGPRASDYNLTIEWSNCVSSEHLYSRLLKTKNYSLSLHKHSYLSHSPSHSCLTLQSIFRHHKPLHDRSLTRSHKNCFTYLHISFTLPIIPTSLSMSLCLVKKLSLTLVFSCHSSSACFLSVSWSFSHTR